MQVDISISDPVSSFFEIQSDPGPVLNGRIWLHRDPKPDHAQHWYVPVLNHSRSITSQAGQWALRDYGFEFHHKKWDRVKRT